VVTALALLAGSSVVAVGAASRRAQAAADPLIAGLRERALASDVALQVVSSLTSEVGPRPAGSAADARAVSWAMATLQKLGFDNVHSEPVTVPHWVRGEETGEIVAPWPQRMSLCALGGSGGTPEEGITAEVASFPTLEALQAAPAEQVQGKIVFLDRRMERTRDERGYGEAVVIRRDGAATAGNRQPPFPAHRRHALRRRAEGAGGGPGGPRRRPAGPPARQRPAGALPSPLDEPRPRRRAVRQRHRRGARRHAPR
jgi:hypothetical protein